MNYARKITLYHTGPQPINVTNDKFSVFILYAGTTIIFPLLLIDSVGVSDVLVSW